MKRSKIILVILILSIVTLVFSGCGGGGSVTPSIPDNEEISKYFQLDVPYIEQNSNNTCLPASAAMVLKYYEDPRTIAEIRDKLALPWQEDGTGGIMVSGHGDVDKLFDYVKSLGFETKKEWDGLTIEKIKDKLEEDEFPIIVLQDFYLDSNKEYDGHFSVIVGYREIGDNDEENKLIINDPWSSRGQYWEVTYSDFKIRNSNWWKEQHNRDSDLSHSYVIWKDASITKTYTITASASSHGSINPSGSVTVNQGSDQSFTITPDTGYQLEDVLVDGSHVSNIIGGESVGGVSFLYVFTNVTEDHTISVTFTSVAPGLVHNINKGTYYNTIQAALDDADNNNTIEVDDGTYDESITFPSGKVIIIKSLNGPYSTIIRGDDGSPTVTPEGSLEETTLIGFTITHNNGQSGRGIYILDGNLNIENCNIIGNYAGDIMYYQWGGGIFNHGTLTITDSTITNNYSADMGGGIFNHGTLTIIDSTISDNHTDTEDASWGGGIVNAGTSTITGSTISNNTSDYGGGIRNSGTLTITDSTISNNLVFTSTGNFTASGGGIYNFGGTTSIRCILTITGSTISDNYASAGSDTYVGGISYCAEGGGICNDGGILIINRSTISDNYASADNHAGGEGVADGGGIWNGGNVGTSITITESIISGNHAGGEGNAWGGGICNRDILTITGSTISDNHASSEGDAHGGGISSDGTLTVTGSTVSDNSANNDGFGIMLWETVEKSTIGGSNPADRNTICGNYKNGYNPSLYQQVMDNYGSLYDTYKSTNYISVYCD